MSCVQPCPNPLDSGIGVLLLFAREQVVGLFAPATDTMRLLPVLVLEVATRSEA